VPPPPTKPFFTKLVFALGCPADDDDDDDDDHRYSSFATHGVRAIFSDFAVIDTAEQISLSNNNTFSHVSSLQFITN
jgi:hypothetical protein